MDKQPATLKLVVGLGNPGAEYARNRHNLGARVVALVAEKIHLKLSHHSHGASWGKIRSGNLHAVLALPLTYMNRSGYAVAALSHYYKVPLENLLVVVDDLNLPLGSLRLRASGSAGGHNGLKSIIAEVNSQDFPRLRLGIGKPPEGTDQADYVLSDFPAGEGARVEDMLAAAGKVVDLWLEQGPAAAAAACKS